jgi:hypothetical protein
MGKKQGIEEIATQFVNLKNELAVKNFRQEYRKWFPGGDQPALVPPLDAQKFRAEDDEWVAVNDEPARTVQRPPELEKSTAERNASFESQLLRNLAEWSKQLRGAWSADVADRDARDAAENTLAQILYSDRGMKELRQVKLGSTQLEPRDLFDKIALVILKASERGLLRTCKGHKHDWPCPTPYLVADEGRRVYCYSRCGDEAKSRAKLNWWRRNLSASARKLKPRG